MIIYVWIVNVLLQNWCMLGCYKHDHKVMHCTHLFGFNGLFASYLQVGCSVDAVGISLVVQHTWT